MLWWSIGQAAILLITGFWQISSRNETSFAGRAAYDTRYARRVSFATDLGVLLATVRVVLRGTGY